MNKLRFENSASVSLLSLALIAPTVGCAVNKVSHDFPKPIVGESSTIVIYREYTFNASNMAIPVSLDGREVARLLNDTRLEILVKPGMSVIGVGPLTMPIATQKDSVHYVCIKLWGQTPVTIKSKEEATPYLLKTTLIATNSK